MSAGPAVSQLGGGLDGVQVVGGHDRLGLRVVQCAVGGNLDILVVGNDLAANHDVHAYLPFVLHSEDGAYARYFFAT